MTRYLNIKDLNQMNHSYNILKGIQKIKEIPTIFKTDIDVLDV